MATIDPATLILAYMVKDEYPTRHSLREIVEIWGPGHLGIDFPGDQLDAIDAALVQFADGATS